MTRLARPLALAFLAATPLAAQLTVAGPHDESRLQHACWLPSNAKPWSDPATWSGAPPAGGDDVTIPAGTTVLLDVDTPSLRDLAIDGRLVFGCGDLELTADRIVVSGELRIGSEGTPFPHDALVHLTEEHYPAGDAYARTLEVQGGTLELHGVPRTSWVQLGANAPAGATSITLASPVDWKPGERIVLASTDFDLDQAEERVVTSVAGGGFVVGLDAPLAYLHWGSIEAFGVDERGEVALLDRSVVVRGPDDAAATQVGGTMTFVGIGSAEVRLSWVEVEALGEVGELGRYPVHFHELLDQTGSYVQGLSVHHCFNRSVVIHGTQNVLVEDTLSYETLGHAFFLEDGTETGNAFLDNLAISTRPPPPGLEILDSDVDPSGFWLMNFDNAVVGNHAAGQDGPGFWLDLSMPGAQDVAPTFVGNVAHSSGDHGFYKEDYNGAAAGGVSPVFESFTAYKNRKKGVYWRSVDLTSTWRDARVADNATGFFLASDGLQGDDESHTLVEDTVVLGESGNVGTPETPDELAYGRSLPDPAIPEGAVLGNEMYEGTVEFRDTTFSDFVETTIGGAPRRAAAFGHTSFVNPWSIDPRNRVSGLTLVNAQPVFLKPNIPAGVGWAALVIWDQDGSLTGVPDAYVTADTPLLEPEVGAVHVPAWNADVVPGPGSGNTYANFRLVDHTSAEIQEIELRSVTRDATHDLRPTSNDTTFATNLLLPDDYDVDFPDASTRSFRIELRFGLPGESTIVSFPYASPAPVAVKAVGTGALVQSASLAHLQAKPDQGWWYDASAQRLHLKARLTGAGTTVLDGGEVTLVVDPD